MGITERIWKKKILNPMEGVDGLQRGQKSILFGNEMVYNSPEGFMELSDIAYAINATAYACITMKARAMAPVPWLMYKKDKNDDMEELIDHPMSLSIKRPNKYEGKVAFLHKMMGHLDLGGEAIIHMNASKGGELIEQTLLRPDRVTLTLNSEQTEIITYDYSCGGVVEHYKPAEIVHIKYFNPADDFRGLAPIAVAAKAIAQHNASKDYNIGLMMNGCRPTGVLKTADSLTDDQYDQLRKEVEQKYAGTANAGKPMILEGGLEFQQIALSPEDMGWSMQQIMAAREICIVEGVPPELCGDVESKTYNSIGESRKALYTEAVLPVLELIKDGYNTWMAQQKTFDGEYFDYNLDSIEVLHKDRRILWTYAINAYNAGLLTKNEARESLQYKAVEDGDEFCPLATGVTLDEEGKPIQNRLPKKPRTNEGRTSNPVTKKPRKKDELRGFN